MNEDAFNLSIRKFLKMVGVSSQREIEQAVAKARAGGAIKGNEKFPASVTLEVPGVKLSVRLDGKIELELAGEDVATFLKSSGFEPVPGMDGIWRFDIPMK